MRYYIGQRFYYYHKETHKRIYVSLTRSEPFQRNTSAWVNPTANEPKHVNN